MVAFVLYGCGYRSIRLLEDPHALAATAPEEWSRERAFDEACAVIAEHYKRYYPARYETWLAERSACSRPHALVDMHRPREAPMKVSPKFSIFEGEK